MVIMAFLHWQSQLTNIIEIFNNTQLRNVNGSSTYRGAEAENSTTKTTLTRKGMVRNEIAVKEDELERLRYELVDHDHDM